MGDGMLFWSFILCMVGGVDLDQIDTPLPFTLRWYSYFLLVQQIRLFSGGLVVALHKIPPDSPHFVVLFLVPSSPNNCLASLGHLENLGTLYFFVYRLWDFGTFEEHGLVHVRIHKGP